MQINGLLRTLPLICVHHCNNLSSWYNGTIRVHRALESWHYSLCLRAGNSMYIPIAAVMHLKKGMVKMEDIVNNSGAKAMAKSEILQGPLVSATCWVDL